MMEDVDTSVVDSAASLSEAALEKYAVALNRYLIRRVRHAQDAPDLTQEIFERFLRKRDRREVIRNPLAYLLGIASHVLGESFFEQKASPVSFDSGLVDEVSEIVSANSSQPADVFGIQQDVVDALSKLPQNQAVALMLVEGEGMTYKEAAKVTGFTRNTIATYVMHGRAAMKEILADYWRDKDARK